MFDYSASYYSNNGDRPEDGAYYSTQYAPSYRFANTEEWSAPSPAEYGTTRPVERRESYEERTRTIRPEDYYDDRSRLYRTEDRYSGRSTRSARSEQDHNWYPSDTVRSSGKNFNTTVRARYPTEAPQYATDSETSSKDVYDSANDRTLRVEEKDWYSDQNRKHTSERAETGTLSRQRNVDKSVAGEKAEEGRQKLQDNNYSSYVGNAEGRPAQVASYGVLDKSKGGVIVGVSGTHSEAPGDCWRACCKPAIITLLLLLILFVFALVAGLLLYFNFSTYKPRTPVGDAPCDKTFCRWGAACVRGPDGTATCQCPRECELVPEAPVCSTEGKTHRSLCELRRDGCEKRINVRVHHEGPCEINDPCRDFQCDYGAKCQSSPDGRIAECKCPETCPKYGDHAASRPVCASDGQDYKDLCEMRRAACEMKMNLTVKFQGKCDPCSGVSCPEPEVCQLDASRSASCRCAETCGLEFTPVCTSDGKTYSNECQARREACRSRRPLRIIYRGQCSSDVNPCEKQKCLPGEECIINKFGIAKCECGPECEPVMRPVCSTDGRTFSSECELKRAACHAKMPIDIAHPGVCGEKGPCQGRACPWGGSCVERGGQARCECPQCPAEFDPVCGSDGISYGNECKLRLEACKYKRDVSVLYKGPCNGCENKKCDHYAVCESDGASEAKCVCPKRCEEGTEYGKVCGSDSETYPSECALRTKACKEQILLSVQFKGDCDACSGMVCKYGARCSAGECVCPTNCSTSTTEPVCANTMVTYPSECLLQQAACHSTIPLTVIFYGDCRERFGIPTTLIPISYTAISNEIHHGQTETPKKTPVSAEREACKDIHCDYEATCELGPDNFPRCSCLFDCSVATSKGTKPVCASDLRMYPSMCAMKLEACQRQEELRLRPMELCQGLEVKPCNGDAPLVDLVTGLELDCGSGPHRKDCPSGSYCHQTTKVARCCKKDKIQEEKKGCEDSWYGCCSDGVSPAQGPEFGGCPSQCQCNKLGSFSETCNPQTQQCDCRPGVGGLKCDRCEPGYWGLPKISAGHQGCIPCGCSMFGSVREDCEQMTGRCVCKPGIQGQKCTICTSHDRVLGPNGCVPPDVMHLPPANCRELNCYFGAVCIERSGLAVCECASTQCPPESMDTLMVCGSDGQTYTSECHLRLQACRTQTDIVVQAFGICREDIISGTDWPLHRYTPMQYTQPDDGIAHLSKSTRHLLVPDPRYMSTIKENENLMMLHRTSVADLIDITNMAAKQTSSGMTANIYPTTKTTPDTITALIGDLCSSNADCLIPNTRCYKGACICSLSHTPSANRQECVTIPISSLKKACEKNPCHHSSTCLDLTDQGFTCICQPHYTGRLCEFRISVQHFDVPSFDGHAYITMKALPAYHKFNIEIEFTAFADNGILIYDQQKNDGTGDFMSLALVNGHVEMRYDLGDGIVSIITPETIEMNRLHRITAKRYHRDGMLKLDDGEDTVGQSRGSLKALDLVEPAYFGYVPTNFSRVYENIGVRQGFIGCIHWLRIGRSQVYPQQHPRSDSSLIYNTRNVHECSENPCASMPCSNGGTCHALDIELYRCACVDGYMGDFCETALDPCSSDPCENATTCIPDGITFKCVCLRDDDIIDECSTDAIKREAISIPQFTGSSYIQLPKPSGLGKSFKIEIWFLAKKRSGVLLYMAQTSSRNKGDFVTINLVDGKVQFRFNLGSGVASMTSSESISLETWHRVKVRRSGRDGLIQLDNSTAVRSSSRGPLLELNLEQPLYLGYTPSWLKVHRLSGISSGFLGAMQRVMINGKSLKILNHNNMCVFPGGGANKHVACSSPGITKYRGPPCFRDSCSGRGLCIPILNEYHCQCEDGWTGDSCDLRITVQDNDVDDRIFQYNARKNKERIPQFGSNLNDEENEMEETS